VTKNHARDSMRRGMEEILGYPPGSFDPEKRFPDEIQQIKKGSGEDADLLIQLKMEGDIVLLSAEECERLKDYADRWVSAGDISVLTREERQDFIMMIYKVYRGIENQQRDAISSALSVDWG